MIPKSICVFCASSPGIDPIYRQQAMEVGSQIAELGSSLVYGGGKTGLMGALADGAIAKNGKVVGIIPKFMIPHELAHPEVTELILVESMHERKLQMHEKSDAVITLPGGFGTFEELFEMLTWIQLGLYKKPVAIINTNGYYDFLKLQIEKMGQEGLLKTEHISLLHFCESFNEALTYFENYQEPKSVFELKKSQT